jgi:hypothetical protein
MVKYSISSQITKKKKAKKKLSKKVILDKKIKEYKRFLKEDEDWDWAYIIRILKYKLERTRKCIISNNIISNSKQIAREIKEVEILLDRVEKDNYLRDLSKEFHKKYGNLKMISKKSEVGKNLSEVTFEYTKETPQNRKQIRSEHHKLFIKAKKMQQDDLKKAFALMHKNIWNWWD